MSLIWKMGLIIVSTCQVVVKGGLSSCKNLIAQPVAALLRGTQSVPVITFTRHS